VVSHPDRPERIAVSAAGDTAAFVIGPGPAGPTAAAGLWHGPLGGRPARIDPAVPDTNLAFAPEGDRFALAAAEQAGSAVIVADPAAAPAHWPRYPIPAFAEQLAWTEAGLFVLAADPGADAASLTSGKPLPAAEQDPLVLPPGGGASPPDGAAAGRAGFRRLWRMDPGTGDAAPASPQDLAIWEFAPVPGGGAIVVASDDPTEAASGAGALIPPRNTCFDGDLTDVAAQARVTVHAEAAGCLNSRWHPGVVPLADGSALTMRSTPATPPQVVRLRPGGEPAEWTALNAGLAQSRRLQVRELRWAGPDGTQIEGLLTEPDDGRAEVAGGAGGAAPRPLVVDIHGGPSLAFHHSWDLPWAELLTGAGYAVLMPNPRGGAGRGQAFGRANLGDPAGADFADIEAGVAHCAALGLADPGRVAAIGASYGGYLTAWAIALGGQFRCGVVIAGISDLVSCRGTANNAPFYDHLLQGRPADRPALYLDRSPVTRLSAASSPALILHGQQDRCVPVGQAEELYAGLREFGIPAEFACYPREGHQATEPAHVADQRERILRWLATYLEGAS
jgi:pimeloyl-ACP methyl ester carboxylesterase